MNCLLQIVIVLYKTKLEDSVSYKTLNNNKIYLEIPYSLLIYNNSPEVFIPTSDDYELYTAAQNNFLAKAYNYALHIAKKNKAKYLLLLDQDTTTTKEYIALLSKCICENSDVAAYIPNVLCGDRLISPIKYNKSLGYFLPPINKSAKLYYNAINSGSIFNIDIIEKIGGFDEDYPLDGLDTQTFYMLCRANMLIKELPVNIYQDLSILKFDDVSEFRKESIIKARKMLLLQQSALKRGVSKIWILMSIIKLLLQSNLSEAKFRLKYIV